MKDRRRGESLWMDWDGDDFDQSDPDNIVLYTIEHVDLEHEVVEGALASALQRMGIATSLGEGYKLVEAGSVTLGWSGSVEGEMYPTKCAEDGTTSMGDHVDEIFDTTWIEVPPSAE